MVTNLPPVEGREQLSAVTNLVMMSGSKKDDAFVNLRKIVRISEQQEETIRLAIKRTYENALNNPYRKRKGRPSGQKNKPGHKADYTPCISMDVVKLNVQWNCREILRTFSSIGDPTAVHLSR